MKSVTLSLAAACFLFSSAARADPLLDQPLCVASAAGAADQIAALLHRGADANAVCANKSGDDHFGPLYLAVKADTAPGVAALLDAGAKVGAQDTKYGLSAVFQIKSPAVGELLFAHGASVSARNARGSTPFAYLVARLGSTFQEAQAEPVALLLLRHGADINGLDGDSTPLMEAIVLGDTDFAGFLLDHHADPTRKDHLGQTALALAMKMEGIVRPEYQHAYGAAEAVLRAHGVTQ